MTHSCLNFLKLGTPSDERAIAVRSDPGAGPGLFWLGGFKSDMKGTKAEALSAWARQQGRACVRFDYSGHGESGGAFEAGTIGRWLEESLAVFAAYCTRTAGGHRLIDGGLDRAPARAGIAPRRCRKRSRGTALPGWC